jgi:alanine-synthesizing transaminase
MKAIRKSNKLDNVCYDIRGAVLQKAKQMEDEGHHIIKLNIGNLAAFGFEAPEEIQLDMIRNLPSAAGYADSKGIFAARKAIMHYTQQKHIKGVVLEDIYIGNGVSELIVMAMNALLNAGDEVLVPAPDYPLWTAAVSLSSGTPCHYLCDEANDWLPDLDDLRARITPRTRALVVINPNNPTGALYPDSVLREMVAIAREHGLIIYADEVYDKVLYDGATHTAIASLSQDVLTVTFNGLSKNYRSCGYRAGWMVFPATCARRATTSRASTCSPRCACAPTCRHSTRSRPRSVAIRVSTIWLRREAACVASVISRIELITAIPGVSCVKPRAALYMFPRLDPQIYPIDNDQEFIAELLQEERVLLVQGSGFNWPSPDHFRLVFLPYEDDLRDAIARIARFLAAYRQRAGTQA